MLRFFLLFQALFTLFLSGGLFFKNRSLKNSTIAGFTLLYALELLYFLYGTTTEVVALYPQLIGRFYFTMGLLYGPLLWFHFQSITDIKFKISWQAIWHLVPALVFNIFAFPITILSDTDRLAFYASEANFFSTVIYFNVARTAHQLIYAIALIRLVNQQQPHLSTRRKTYLSGIAIIYLLAVVLVSFLVAFANSWRDFSWYYVLSNSIVFLIAYVLYQNPDFFQRWKKKYEQSNLNEKDQRRIRQKIEHAFQEEQLYLDNQLSIQKLAVAIDEKPPYLSQTFTTLFQSNFNDYTNEYRIEYAKQLLTNPAYAHYKIEAIALAAGFNNKVTFYKAFSKFTHTTPSKYRKIKVK